MPVSYFTQNSGLIKVSGADLVDFVNRMSTNDFRSFPESTFRYTVLTNDKGRIIDVVNFVNFGEDKFLICTAGYEYRIITHLEKYIIMDDVKLEKCDTEYSKIIIYTDEPENLSSEIFNIKCEKNKAYRINEKDILFSNDLKVSTLNIVCRESHISVYKNIMKDQKSLECDEYEFKRISNLVPEGENELNDQINPMECGLDEYISFNKGCYIGQEVIARIESQGKIPKRMVRIESVEELKSGDKVFISDGKEVGFISSVIKSDEKYFSLAFIRSTELTKENKFYSDFEGKKSELRLFADDLDSISETDSDKEIKQH